MDIMELGAIGEMVGGVAVLATLIYLVVQVRQNTHLLNTRRKPGEPAPTSKSYGCSMNGECSALKMPI